MYERQKCRATLANVVGGAVEDADAVGRHCRGLLLHARRHHHRISLISSTREMNARPDKGFRQHDVTKINRSHMNSFQLAIFFFGHIITRK